MKILITVGIYPPDIGGPASFVPKIAKMLTENNVSLPAYDQCLKASHIFNILDARGVISVAQRAEYISRIREITKGAAEIWLKSQT